MEKEILKEWMERFFLAELTMDEERELYQYLCANEVPAELRKDREVILALCSTAEEDIELPEGAAERLEAMLDGLEKMKEELETDDTVKSKESGKIFKIPRLFFRAACVAGVAIALFVLLPDRVTEPLLTEVYEEEDTFDNPEDAMRCFKVACGDMLLAINAARNNTYEIENVLEKTVNPYMELLMFIEKK